MKRTMIIIMALVLMAGAAVHAGVAVHTLLHNGAGILGSQVVAPAGDLVIGGRMAGSTSQLCCAGGA